MALCFPFYRLKHYLRARFFTIPILILAPLYNMPRFFEYEIKSRLTKFCANFSGRGVPYEFTEAEYDNLTSADIASCADDWEDRETAALVVTDFRKSFIYIQVRIGRRFLASMSSSANARSTLAHTCSYICWSANLDPVELLEYDTLLCCTKPLPVSSPF